MSYQIRPHTYHGEAGYLLSGRPNGQTGGWPLSVFFTDREAAERWRGKMKVNPRYFPGLLAFQSMAARRARVAVWLAARSR